MLAIGDLPICLLYICPYICWK